MYQRKVIAFLSPIVFAFIAGCGSGNGGPGDGGSNFPDLAPHKPLSTPGPVGFCKLTNEAKSLEISVKNSGKTPSSAFVRVDFSHDGSKSGTTATIPPGEIRTVVVDIPTPIPPGDYNFTINVDPDNAVKESNEGNNKADGHCIT